MRVAIYARTASADPQKIESQTNSLLGFAKKREWLIQGVYIDDGVSGFSSPRPGFDDLLKACRRSKVDIVLVVNLSRLTRNIEYTFRILGQMEAWGVRLIALHDHFDSMDRKGWIRRLGINKLADNIYWHS